MMDNDNGSDISTTIEANSPPSQNKNTLRWWALLSLFSINIIFTYASDDDLYQADKYLFIACPSVSIIFSILVYLIHYLRPMYIMELDRRNVEFNDRYCSIPESIMSLILAGLWGGALPRIMDPSKGMAQMFVGKAGGDMPMYQVTISNANIFISSWGVYLCVWDIWIEKIWGCCKQRGGLGWWYTRTWSLLAVVSSLMLLASVNFQNNVCNLKEELSSHTTCQKNKIGLLIGIIGAIISLLMKFLSVCGKDNAIISMISSTVMALMYTFCAYSLAFGNGPATYMCTQYIAAWAGFFVSFALFGSTLKVLLNSRGGGGFATYTSAAATDTENETELAEAEEVGSNEEHLV